MIEITQQVSDNVSKLLAPYLAHTFNTGDKSPVECMVDVYNMFSDESERTFALYTLGAFFQKMLPV